MPKEDWIEILKKDGLESKSPSNILLEQSISAFLHKHHNQFTEIQFQAIEPIYSGENAILISSTASGKTEAAVIPIAARILEDRKGSLCIYIAPTRALLNDLYKRLNAPLNHLNIKLGIRHGEKSISTQDSELSFILTTPESLDVLLCKDYPFFSKVKFVICDEIHQLYGSPRGLQLLFLLERLKKKTSRKIQRIALSATVGDPKKVGEWFRGGDSHIRIISAENKRDIEPEFHWLDESQSLRDVIQQSEAKKILIFANSRRMCDALFLELRDFPPYRVFVHFSNLGREQREYAESQFKTSEYAICIATTTLELGIDIGSIETIILFEPPPSVVSFLQRIGRGSRRTEKNWVIMTPKNPWELAQFFSLTLLAQEGKMESIPWGQFYSVIIQQIFSLIAAKPTHRVHIKEIEEICQAFPWIEEEEISLILKGLTQQKYLRFEPGWSSYQMGSALSYLYNQGSIYSNISDTGSGIPVFQEGRFLANLSFPGVQLQIGSVFLFMGRFWEVISIRKGRINVRPTNPVPFPITPSYGNSGWNFMSSLVAGKIKNLLTEKEIILKINADEITQNHLKKFGLKTRSALSERSIVQTPNSPWLVYFTFAGSIENQIIQILFSRMGYPCHLLRNLEGIGIVSEKPLNFKAIPGDQEQIEKIIQENWESFIDFVDKGHFFPLLPSSLKRKEIVSQIIDPERLSKISKFRDAEIIQEPEIFW